MITDVLLPWHLWHLTTLKEEISLYASDDDLWRQEGEFHSGGTLTLHLIGLCHHYIGAGLGDTGYVRDRDAEYTTTDVPREVLFQQIDDVIAMIQAVLPTLTDEGLFSRPVIEYGGQPRSAGEILVLVFGRFGFFLGQLTYHRLYVTAGAAVT